MNSCPSGLRTDLEIVVPELVAARKLLERSLEHQIENVFWRVGLVLNVADPGLDGVRVPAYTVNPSLSLRLNINSVASILHGRALICRCSELQLSYSNGSFLECSVNTVHLQVPPRRPGIDSRPGHVSLGTSS